MQYTGENKRIHTLKLGRILISSYGIKAGDNDHQFVEVCTSIEYNYVALTITILREVLLT